MGEDSAEVRNRHRELAKKKVDPSSVLQAASFKRKAQILRALDLVTVSAKRDLDLIYEQLRNPLMHADEYVNDSPPALKKFAKNRSDCSVKTST